MTKKIRAFGVRILITQHGLRLVQRLCKGDPRNTQVPPFYKYSGQNRYIPGCGPVGRHRRWDILLSVST